MKDVRCDAEWVATSVYGPNNANDRGVFWAELNHVAGLWNHPWVVGGDFNVIRFPSEKKGGCSISSTMRDFNDWIRAQDLCDLPLQGAKFTWSNMQQFPVSRLDRFLVPTDWLDLFPDCAQRMLARPISDHCPLLLETGIEFWGPPSFKFEIMWLSEKGFSDVVKEWRDTFFISGWIGYQLTQKLKFLKTKLKIWRKKVFGSIVERKNLLLTDIQNIDGKEEGLLEEEDRVRRKNLQE